MIPAERLEEMHDGVLRAGAEIGEAMRTAMDKREIGAPAGGKIEGWEDKAKAALTARGLEPGELPEIRSGQSVEAYNSLLADASAELHTQHGLVDGFEPGSPTGRFDAGVNNIAFLPELAPFLADPRLLAVAKAVLDPHIRIAQLEIAKTNHPRGKNPMLARMRAANKAPPPNPRPWQDIRGWVSAAALFPCVFFRGGSAHLLLRNSTPTGPTTLRTSPAGTSPRPCSAPTAASDSRTCAWLSPRSGSLSTPARKLPR